MPRSSSVRRLTGTSARSSRPWVRDRRAPCSQRRSAPAATASTTSLIVPPNASFTTLKSSGWSAPSGSGGAGRSRLLSGTFGAGFISSQATSPIPSATSTRLRRASRAGAGRRCSDAPADAQRQLRDVPRRPRASSCASLGSGCGSHGRTGGVRPTGHGVRVEQHRREVDAGDAVDERVVRLADQREAVALEALHEPHLPERLRAVEPLGEDPPDQQRELVVVARRGQRGVADVVLEVEARVVHPHGPARPEAAGRRASAGSAGRGAGAPRRARRTRRSSGGGPSKTQTAADVHVRALVLLASGSWRPSR